MKNIKNYLWFIKESQSFMKGYNPVIVFFQSLYKGFGYCREMNKWDSYPSNQEAYLNMNRNIEM